MLVLRISDLEERVLTLRTRIIPTFLVVVSSMLLAGCPPRVNIAKLNQDPGRYAGKQISIAGRVTDSFGALGRGAFQVDDGTGRMWVVTGHYGVPETSTNVAVSGHIEQRFSFGGRSFAVILHETERRH